MTVWVREYWHRFVRVVKTPGVLKKVISKVVIQTFKCNVTQDVDTWKDKENK